MSRLAVIKSLFLHSYWADARIFDFASRIDKEKLFSPLRMPHPSLYKTLFHAIGAEWLWINRCQGTSPSAYMSEKEITNLPDLREKWQEQQQITIGYLNHLTDADLDRAIDYQSISGVPRSNILWHILVHVPMHSHQHRAEAAQILTEFGESPGNLDFYYYTAAVEHHIS